MKKLLCSVGFFALAFAYSSEIAFAGDAGTSGATANNLVSSAASGAAAGAAAAQTAGAAASAVGGGIGGGVGPAVSNFNEKFASSGGFNFNSRALTGKSAARKPRAGFWVQAGYTAIDNDENGGEFDGSIINVTAGFDYKPAKFNGKMVIGLAVGYENLDIDTEFNNGTFDGDGFSITPYIGYGLGKHWSVSALAGVGFIDYENSRTNGAVTGDFDAIRAFGAINLLGNYRKKRWRISPSIGVLGLWEEQDSYTEAGTSTTVVGKTRVHLVRLSAGAEIGYLLKNKKVEPFVSAKMLYDPDRNSPVTLTTGQIASDDEFAGVFGAGLNISGKKVSGQIKYETQQLKNEIQTHAVIGRIRFNF